MHRSQCAYNTKSYTKGVGQHIVFLSYFFKLADGHHQRESWNIISPTFSASQASSSLVQSNSIATITQRIVTALRLPFSMNFYLSMSTRIVAFTCPSFSTNFFCSITKSPRTVALIRLPFSRNQQLKDCVRSSPAFHYEVSNSRYQNLQIVADMRLLCRTKFSLSKISITKNSGVYSSSISPAFRDGFPFSKSITQRIVESTACLSQPVLQIG